MSAYDFDLFVVGAGSGGVSASRRAAVHGARAGICEEYRVGGTCVIRGCVPKKLLTYSAHFAEDVEDAAGYGWQVEGARFDWATLIANKDREIDRLNGIYLRMLEGAGVSLIEGRAELEDAHTIVIGENRVTVETILIATGARPWTPEVPGIEHAISSNEAFHLETLPERVVVVGGGFIAVEFAGIFHGLGSHVSQLYRGEQILRGFDRDVRDALAREMLGRGIDLRVDCQVARIDRRDGHFVVTTARDEVIETDLVMYATGRRPNVQGLGLAAMGVETGRNGAIVVDDWGRTSVDNIYALGDVTDRMNLTPVAINQGRAFADTVYGGTPRQMDYRFVPSAVFSNPSVGCAGLTEEEARESFDVDIYKSVFRPMKHTLSGREEKTMMKLIVDAKSDRVLGAHMVGPDAAEIIQGIGVALTCGATKAQFDATVGVHPSAAEEFVTMREKFVAQEAQAAE
ncbi:MAG: glutathione-disulfide reductase [Alphaproteobacteria bacterium]|nr:glutathione-disulfide reductase [Alphaproteobacteria bacterium]